MAQYCRYCSKLQVTSRRIYCKVKRKRIKEPLAKTTNYCPYYDLTYVDAFGENERGYQPRSHRIADAQCVGQMNITDFLKEDSNEECGGKPEKVQ